MHEVWIGVIFHDPWKHQHLSSQSLVHWQGNRSILWVPKNYGRDGKIILPCVLLRCPAALQIPTSGMLCKKLVEINDLEYQVILSYPYLLRWLKIHMHPSSRWQHLVYQQLYSGLPAIYKSSNETHLSHLRLDLGLCLPRVGRDTSIRVEIHIHCDSRGEAALGGCFNFFQRCTAIGLFVFFVPDYQ